MFRFTDLIIFEMTRDCNLRCEYCLMKEKDLHRGEIIDFDLFKKIVDRIIEQRIINHRADILLDFNFHGGEFTLLGKKRFYQYLEYAYTQFSNHGVHVNFGMQTNGTLLDDEFLNIIKKFGCNVGVSFDGPKGNFHRMGEEGTQKLQRVLERLRKIKISYGTIPVVTKKNIKYIKSTIKHLVENDVKFYKMNPVGDFTLKRADSLSLSGFEIYHKIMKPELKRYLLNGLPPREGYTREAAEAALIDLVTSHEDYRRSGCGGKICGAGVSMIAVRPDGQMGYCDRYTKDSEENYIEHALDYDFLGLHQLNKTIRLAQIKHEILKQGCDTCKARYICFNGCLAFYYSKHGTYGIEKSETCYQYRAIHSFVEKHLIQILRAYAKTGEKIPVHDTLHEYKPEVVARLRRLGLKVQYRTFEGSSLDKNAKFNEYLRVIPYICKGKGELYK